MVNWKDRMLMPSHVIQITILLILHSAAIERVHGRKNKRKAAVRTFQCAVSTGKGGEDKNQLLILVMLYSLNFDYILFLNIDNRWQC